MKQYILPAFILLFLSILSYGVLTWIRVEKLTMNVENSLDILVSFYLSLERDHVAKISLSPADASVMQFREKIRTLQKNVAASERVERLREAQRAASFVFAVATGSLVGNAEYEVWKRESSPSGRVYPLLLTYNQAAQAFNDGLRGLFPHFIAQIRGLTPLPLIEVNGDIYKQQPLSI